MSGSEVREDVQKAEAEATGLKARAAATVARARAAQPWLDHVVRAWTRYKGNSGDYLAGGITYFSFLAIFPLVLLGVSIAAFVLKAHPDTLKTLLDNIEKNAPGGLGDTIKSAVNTAIQQRGAVGLVGLVGTLLSGLGWINNLRVATSLVWGTGTLKRPFVKAKIADAIVLVGLGAGLLASVAITVAGTALTPFLLKHTGLDAVPGSRFVGTLGGLLVAVLADMLIFGFLLLRLPRVSVPRRIGLRGALLAAVGFEILKIVGTYYIKRVTASPAASALGSIIGVLIFLNLVFRFLLFCVAWIATAVEAQGAAAGTPATVVAAPVVSEPPPPAPSPAAVAGTLVGTGAVLGAGSLAAARLWRRRSRRRRRRERAEISG